jgi:hypothetical protein
MRIATRSNRLHFSNIITYDYVDLATNPSYKNYQQFLKDPTNYDTEIETYWQNLQGFLDEEANKVNGTRVTMDITFCSIGFREPLKPFVQWVIEFEAKAKPGINIYENNIESEILEYPIYSLYILASPLKVKRVQTTLDYAIDETGRFIEYFGDAGQKLGEYECIELSLPEINQ